MHVGPMDPERAADGVSEFSFAQLILTREDFDSIQLIERALDRHSQAQGKVVDVHPAIFGWKRFFAKNPEMSATTRHLECSFDSVLFQLQSEIGKVTMRPVVVCVDGHP